MLGQYGLDKNSAIFGHFELHDGKPDPGPGYLEFFKQEVKKAC